MEEFLNESIFAQPHTGFIFALISVGMLILCIVLIIICEGYRRKARRVRSELAALDEEFENLEKEYAEMSTQKKLLDGRVEELRRTKERISRVAYKDALTELPNRNAVTDLLDGITQTLSAKETVAVMLLNISNFSDIIDMTGYPGGEELLIDATHRLAGVLGEDDYLARFDTDRFMVVTQKLEDIDAYEKKLKLVLSVFSEPYVLSARECYADVNIGVTFAPKDGNQSTVLIRYAQMALDMSRTRGRNMYYYFNHELVERISERMELQAEVKKAVETESFSLVYKHLLDDDGKKTAAVLAIPCWVHTQRGALEPKHYMWAVQDDLTLERIGEFVLENVCAMLARRAKAGLKGTLVRINVSARELFDKKYYEFAKSCLQRYNEAAEGVEMVIEPELLFSSREGLYEVIGRFSSLGISFKLQGLGKDAQRMGLELQKDYSYGDVVSESEL